MVKLRTSPYPEGKPRSGWVRTYIVAPHRVNGMVEFSYSLHEDQAAKSRRDDPFYYGSHKAMIRPPEIPHHRIKRTVDGKFIHVSKAEIAPEDMEDFLESDPAAYQWETKTPLLWTAPQGSLPPEMFPTYWGDPEALDPQWPRESFVLDEADEIGKLLAKHDEGLEIRKTFGDHIGTTLDLQVGASADDGRSGEGGANPDYHSNSDAPGSVGFGTFNTRTWSSWYRWTGVSGLSGVTIDVAHISLWGERVDDGSDIQTKIFADDAAAPVAPTSKADHDGKTRTTAGTDWDNPGLSITVATNSPTTVGFVQELADSYDPSAIQVLHDDDGSGTGADNFAFPHMYDGDTSEAAKIHIELAGVDDFIGAITQTPTHLGRFGPATMVPY